MTVQSSPGHPGPRRPPGKNLAGGPYRSPGSGRSLRTDERPVKARSPCRGFANQSLAEVPFTASRRCRHAPFRRGFMYRDGSRLQTRDPGSDTGLAKRQRNDVLRWEPLHMPLTRDTLIREARERAELARRARTSPSAVVRYETGRAGPRIETARRCIEACGFELRIDLVRASPQRQAAADAALARDVEDRLRTNGAFTALAARLRDIGLHRPNSGNSATGCVVDGSNGHRTDPAGAGTCCSTVGVARDILRGSLCEGCDPLPRPRRGSSARR